LPKGKIALTCLGAVAMTAGVWAAYSYAVSSIPLLISSAAHARAAIDTPQISNADAKGDRLPIASVAARYLDAMPAEPAPAPAAFSLASASTAAIEPPKARIEPRADSRKPAADKSKRAEPAKLLLDDAQIAALRDRLKLTPTQEEFWPAVEVTLRNVVRQHARKHPRPAPHGKAPQIDVNSPEVQQLISAAVPLIMRMSEAQKREVRQLARLIGLDTVASRI
jgi:hypothetical protein